MPLGSSAYVHREDAQRGCYEEPAEEVERKLAIIEMLTRIVLLHPHKHKAHTALPSCPSSFPHPVYVLPSYRHTVCLRSSYTYTATCSPSLFPTPCPFTYLDAGIRVEISSDVPTDSSMTTAVLPPPSNLPLHNIDANVLAHHMTTPVPVDSIGIGNPANPNEPQAELLKRVLSSGSNASNTTATTPKMTTQPLSPGSGGARTPKAKAAGLKSPETAPASTGRAGTSEITSGVDDLQVKSPIVESPAQAPESIDQLMQGVTSTGAPTTASSRPIRKDTASTEAHSSESGASVPTGFGSSYGPEGFPSGTNETDDGPMTSQDLHLTAQAALAVAQADEAIKQLNGTSSVIQGPPAVPTANDPYALPRGYADFVNPQVRPDAPDFNIHRQSSTSSSATASTSSEESDLCIPRIEWVNTTAKVLSPGSANTFLNSPYGIGVGAQTRRSPGKMAPPNAAGTGRRTSGERPALGGPQNSLPLGATAHSPGGLKNGKTLADTPAGAGSALPADVEANATAEDDDEERTVGKGRRNRSSSSSTQSDQSGLDLLWKAAHDGKPAPNTNSPYDQSVQGATLGEGKGKRKAGADAVAQWRQGGIPSGPGDAKIDEESKRLSKKRRRSEIGMEEIDPALRDADAPIAPPTLANAGGTFDEEVKDIDMHAGSPDDNGHKRSGSDAGSNFGGSEYESVASLDSTQDPEYMGEPASGKKPGVRSKAVTGAKKGKGRASTGTSNTNGATGNGKAGGSKKARKSEGDKDSSGGGGGKGGGGANKKVSSAINPANVQCEYVNPLPVSQS